MLSVDRARDLHDANPQELPDDRSRKSEGDFLGIRVDLIDRNRAMRQIQTFTRDRRNGSPARQIFFANVHTIHLARQDARLRQIVNGADLVLPDGSGLAIAGKILGTPIVENLNGTDFTPHLLRWAETEGHSVYFFGSRPEINAATTRNVREHYPGLAIAGAHHGHYSPGDEAAIVQEINRAEPDILLVALGSPLQELWIARHAHELRVGVCLAVGGLFDFLSGETPRAPIAWRRMGVEWMYRFLHDPAAKWKRVVIEAPMFLSRVLTEKLLPDKDATRHPREKQS